MEKFDQPKQNKNKCKKKIEVNTILTFKFDSLLFMKQNWLAQEMLLNTLTKSFASGTRIRHISTTNVLRKIYQVKSAEEFEERVNKSNRPVIVDFYAT